MTPSDARTAHRPLAMFGSRSRQLRASLVFHQPFSDMPSPLPRWTTRVRASIASPRLRAFPVSLAGRRPHRSFRGLLGVHSRYGLPDRSAAQGDLCHEASALAVARQSRSSASEPNRQLLGWSLPPTGLMVVSRHTTKQEHCPEGAMADGLLHGPAAGSADLSGAVSAAMRHCRDYLVRARWPAGFRCTGCGHDQAYSHKKRLIEECAACGKQHSMLAGTIFEQTKTGLSRWFLAIYLVTSSKGGISAMELQRQMGFGSAIGPPGLAAQDQARDGRAGPHAAQRCGSRPMRPWSAAPGRASPAAAPAGKSMVAGAVESRRGQARGRRLGRLRLQAVRRRLGQQPGRLSRPERRRARPSRHRRLVGLSRARGRGLRPRADPARPLLGRCRAPPAGHPPGLRARQALAARHPPWRGQRQAPASLSRRVRLPLVWGVGCQALNVDVVTPSSTSSRGGSLVAV